MKKILFITLMLFFTQISFAQSASIDYSEILNTTTMPSDEKIRKILSQFSYSQEESEKIFQETRKQLQEIYATKNAKLLEEKAIEGVKLLNEGHLLPQDFMK